MSWQSSFGRAWLQLDVDAAPLTPGVGSVARNERPSTARRRARRAHPPVEADASQHEQRQRAAQLPQSPPPTLKSPRRPRRREHACPEPSNPQCLRWTLTGKATSRSPHPPRPHRRSPSLCPTPPCPRAPIALPARRRRRLARPSSLQGNHQRGADPDRAEPCARRFNRCSPSEAGATSPLPPKPSKPTPNLPSYEFTC